jgi:S1-C subfamily serine protease
MTRATLALLAVLALVAGPVAGCGFGGDDDDGDGGERTTTTTRVEVIDGLGDGDDGFDPRAIYKQEAPGVVTVISLFGGDSLEELDDASSGVGSGFVLNGDGEIATNAHVVTTGNVPDLREARQVYVGFADGNQVEAEVRGYDPEADIALLEVDPDGLTLRPLPLGESDKVEVGMPVAAIGSPFSEERSLSVGVVSAIDRTIRGLTAFQISGAVQTDAAINPGNSGGPLVDADGKVIGINQQIRTNTGGGEGVGFAVPVDVARRSLEQLREKGEVSYAYLGVETVAIYPQLRERFDLPVDKGAWVQDVEPGTPAAEAGIRGGRGEVRFQIQTYAQGGDIITEVEGKPIADANDLSSAVAQFQPGQEVTVEVHRGSRTEEVEVKLGERPLSAPAGGG